ncbi:MAG: 50S ribosomal protein L9 [Anaerolineae bacterium]|nr:50S ribosomal protein L9 [Anaerolineae bacterium]
MKVMLIKDVYKLGRAGDIKKVANGFGRNFLIPQGLAVIATPGALKQVDRIQAQAEIRRDGLNEELKGLAKEIDGIELLFSVKAGETDKLYGSITKQNVADSLQEKTRYEIKHQQIDMHPIRMLGEFTASIRLTIDLVPEIKIIVNREGEAVKSIPIDEPQEDEAAPDVEAVGDEAPISDEPQEVGEVDEVEEAVVDESSDKEKK